MKHFVGLLLVAIFIQDISCNEDSILSKFHQNTFKIKDVRGELIRYDKNFIERWEMKVFKYNRTTVAHNGTFIVKVDVTNETQVLVDANKFLSNDYRRFGVRFQVGLQKAYAANVVGVKEISKCGNITSLLFRKGITYHVCNFVLDENHLPPLIPNGKYRLDVTILHFNKEVALVYIYNEIYTPIVYP